MAEKNTNKTKNSIRKAKKKEEVIEVAVDILLKNGIQSTRIADIAHEANVGEASVYRYFKTKVDLIIAVATLLWKREIKLIEIQFDEENFRKLNGIERVRKILNIFLELYYKHPEFVRFSEEFDNYIVKENIAKEKLVEYEKNIINMRQVTFEAIKLGEEDGTIRKNIDINEFYITTTHALMSLCQKLKLRGTILTSDSEVSGEEQVNLLIEMALYYIKSMK